MNNFTYFAQPLESICEDGCFVPAFVDKCVEFVENSGGDCEKCNHVQRLVSLFLVKAIVIVCQFVYIFLLVIYYKLVV